MKPRPVEEEGAWLAEQACTHAWTELCAVRAMERELATIALRVRPEGHPRGACDASVPPGQHDALIAWERRALAAWRKAVQELADA